MDREKEYKVTRDGSIIKLSRKNQADYVMRVLRWIPVTIGTIINFENKAYRVIGIESNQVTLEPATKEE